MIPSSIGASIPVCEAGLLQQLLGRRDLVERRDHRQHQLERVARGGDPERGPQLRGQKLGPGERQADPADTEERVLLRRHRQRRQRLVGAGVERAHDQRPAVQRGRDLGQLLGLLVLAGERRAIQEQELGPQQPDAFGAGSTARRASAVEPRLANTSIRVPSVVTAGSWARACAASCAARSRSPRCAGGGDQRRVGVDGHGSGVAVEQQRRGVGDAEHGVAEADHGGQAERAGEDRGVGGGRAAGGDDPEHPVGVQAGSVGGRELVGDHDRGRPRRRRPGPGAGPPQRSSGCARRPAGNFWPSPGRPNIPRVPPATPAARASAAARADRRRPRRSPARRAAGRAAPGRRPRRARSRGTRRSRPPARRRSRPGRARAARRRRAAPGARRRSRPRQRRRGRRSRHGRARSRSGRRRARRRAARVRAPASPAARAGGGGVRRRRPRRRRSSAAGPIATPAEAATPVSTSPGCRRCASECSSISRLFDQSRPGVAAGGRSRRRGGRAIRRRELRGRGHPVAETLAGQRLRAPPRRRRRPARRRSRPACPRAARRATPARSASGR